MKNLKEVYNITLEDCLNIYERLGFKARIITEKYISCILLSDKDNTPVQLVYMSDSLSELNYDNVKDILIDLELEFKDYNCNNYILISKFGYSNTSSFIKEKKVNVYDIQNLNIKLEDASYLEEIIKASNSNKKYFELNAHNKIAYDNIKNEFNNGNKRIYIKHATGTGKSIVVSKYINDDVNGNALLLSSSSSILNQFSKHLSSFDSSKLKMFTYNKLSQINNSELDALKEFNPELIILDEFHRCGAKIWGNSVNELLNSYPNSNVLGTSATPIRYLDNTRDMGEELFEGNIVSNIGLYEAIVRGILPMPTYVVAMYEFDSSIKELKDKVLKSKCSEIEKTKNLKKIEILSNINETSALVRRAFNAHIGNKRNFIVFCKNYAHLKEVKNTVYKWFENYNKEHNLKSNINMFELYFSKSNNSSVVTSFKESIENNSNNDFNLLFSIDIANEGIHSKYIDGVILLRQTKSPIVYYQQIGRTLHINPVNKPVIFDFVNNSDYIQSHNFITGINEAYEEVNDNTNSLLNELKDVDIFLKDIYDETRDTLSIFNEIEDTLKVEWNAMFEELVKFKKIKGTIVVRPSDNYKLYNWVSRNRFLFSKNKLSPDRKMLLDSIGFIYSPYEYSWLVNYQNLKEYKSIHNHLNVSEKTHYQLAKFISAQRVAYKSGTLSEERIKLLEDIGMMWDVSDYKWNSNYSELIKLYNQLGSLHVIETSTIINIDGTTFMIDENLMEWIRKQRTYYKMGVLKEERIAKLESLGLALDISKKIRDDNFERLLLFIKNNGHANVKSKDDKRLYNWVRKVRAYKKDNKLDEDTIKKYDSIGFTWSVREAVWDEHFSNYIKYMMKYHTPIMEKGEEGFDDTLFKWARTQRGLYNKGELSKEREDRLNSIGFIWDVLEYKWMLMYNELKDFIYSLGETKYTNYLTMQYKGNMPLSRWITNQKRAFKSNQLPEHRYNLLLELGIDFN